MAAYPCTPEGNCFAIVQEMTSFGLRIVKSSALSGPPVTVEPKHVIIGGPDGLESCEEILFIIEEEKDKFALNGIVKGLDDLPLDDV